jgi:hypothetical protein
MANYTYNYN